MREGILYNTDIEYDSLTDYSDTIKSMCRRLGEDYVAWIESKEKEVLVTRDSSIVNTLKSKASATMKIDNGVLYEIEHCKLLDVVLPCGVLSNSDTYLLVEWVA